MSDFLATMARSSAQRSAQAQTICSFEEAQVRSETLPPTTALNFTSDHMGIIAEIKVRSPAEGQLADDVSLEDIVARAREYVRGGASLLSVLTEPDRFEGHLDYLAAVKAQVGKSAAVMRKDFLVDCYQIYEARLHGADGVLLIARILDDSTLEKMLETARQLGMFVLLEAFDKTDLERIAPYASAQVLLGVNCRDLTTLEIDPARFSQFIAGFPQDSIKVAESGIHTVEDAVRLHALGYDMALIGTMLMKASHPGKAISDVITATRAIHT